MKNLRDFGENPRLSAVQRQTGRTGIQQGVPWTGAHHLRLFEKFAAIRPLAESERLAEIDTEVRQAGKKTYHFEADLTDENGQVVARVSKEIYVRFRGVETPSEPA